MSGPGNETVPPPQGPAPEGAKAARLGVYEVHELVGSGGMGRVYRAVHTVDRRAVALKVIFPASDEERERELGQLFLREAAALRSIQHPNVVACFDVNEALFEGRPVLYMAMELLEGETLIAKIERGPLPLDEVLTLAKGICRALEALHGHARRIIHRDLKPHNVFVTRDGTPKLLDFGLAALADWRMTRLSSFAAGSRPYMSPEQFEGLRACTERSDLYSLGVTIFQATTGVLPFKAENEGGYLVLHSTRSPPSFLEARAGLPSADDPRLASLQNVVTRLLAKKPAERHGSAGEVLRELEAIASGATVARPSVTRPERERAVRRLLAVTLLVVAFVAVAAVAILAIRSRVPAKVQQAEDALSSGDIDGAQKLVADALSVDPENRFALELAPLIRERRVFLEELARVRGLRDLDPASALEGYRKLGAAPHDPRVVRADEAAEMRDAERLLAARLGDRFAAEETALRSRLGSAAFDPAAALESLARLAASDDLRAKVETLRRELDALRARAAELDRIDDALARGAVDAARAGLAALPEDTVLAERRSALARAVAGRIALRATAAKADEASLRSDFGEAERLWDDFLARAGDAPERADSGLGRTRASAEAARERSRFEIALAKARALARDGHREEALAHCGLARRLEGAASAERRRELDSTEDGLRDAIHRDALADAARGSREARLAAGRAALLAVPLAEVAPLASAIAEIGSLTAVTASRLVTRLAALPRSRAAYAILEQVTAELGRPDGFVLVPRTRAVLGSESAELSNPVHEVEVGPFYIAINETTNAEALRFEEARSLERRHAAPGKESLPAGTLGLEQALELAAWREQRLPTPDEWEIAASVEPGGKRRAFPWGDEWSALIAPPRGELRPVGALALDVSPWGCRDMGGNAQEWTAERRPDGAVVGVLKGGSFDQRSRSEFRAEMRSFPAPRSKGFESWGMRLAATPPAPDLGFWHE